MRHILVYGEFFALDGACRVQYRQDRSEPRLSRRSAALEQRDVLVCYARSTCATAVTSSFGRRGLSRISYRPRIFNGRVNAYPVITSTLLPFSRASSAISMPVPSGSLPSAMTRSYERSWSSLCPPLAVPMVSTSYPASIRTCSMTSRTSSSSSTIRMTMGPTHSGNRKDVGRFARETRAVLPKWVSRLHYNTIRNKKSRSEMGGFFAPEQNRSCQAYRSEAKRKCGVGKKGNARWLNSSAISSPANAHVFTLNGKRFLPNSR